MKSKLPGYEKRKIAIDLLKHFATLAVACIAVVVTFLPQLNELEQSKTLLLVAVVSFLISVICTVISSIILLANIESLPKIFGSRLHNLLRVSTFSVIAGFLIGVGSLCVLILKNLA